MSVKRYDSMGFESEHGIYVRAVDYDAVVQQHSKSGTETDADRVALAQGEIPAHLAAPPPHDSAGGLRSACEALLSAMEMQEGRELEELHIPQPSAKAIWEDAKAKARAVLGATEPTGGWRESDPLSPIEKFALEVIDSHRNGGYPGDVDGGLLQEALTRHGLLRQVDVTAPCSDEACPCAETGGVPGQCYRLSPDVLKMRSLLSPGESRSSSSDDGFVEQHPRALAKPRPA